MTQADIETTYWNSRSKRWTIEFTNGKTLSFLDKDIRDWFKKNERPITGLKISYHKFIIYIEKVVLK